MRKYKPHGATTECCWSAEVSANYGWAEAAVLPPPLFTQSCRVVILVCAVVWGRGGERSLLEEPASLFLSLSHCLPTWGRQLVFAVNLQYNLQMGMKSYSDWQSKKRQRGKKAKWAAFWKLCCRKIQKECLHKNQRDQNQRCLGSMYNSVCFIILSWVFAALVFPGKAPSFSPVFRMSLHAAVFYVAFLFLSTHRCPLFSHSPFLSCFLTHLCQ